MKLLRSVSTCILSLVLCNASFASNADVTALPFSLDPTLEGIPSAYWPAFVTITEEKSTLSDSDLTLKVNSRGTLIRIEDSTLIVDFGRAGVQQITPSSTDFYDSLNKLISGNQKKEFPNLAMQIANKLIDFSRAGSKPIHFDEVRQSQLYLLIYLDQYAPEQAQALLDFGSSYKSLKEMYPSITGVILPKDKTYYDFGATTLYPIPFITPHLRAGYLHSLYLQPANFPTIYILDSNGKLLGKTTSDTTLSDLPTALADTLNRLHIDWTPEVDSRSSRQRSASWLVR